MGIRIKGVLSKIPEYRGWNLRVSIEEPSQWNRIIGEILELEQKWIMLMQKKQRNLQKLRDM